MVRRPFLRSNADGCESLVYAIFLVRISLIRTVMAAEVSSTLEAMEGDDGWKATWTRSLHVDGFQAFPAFESVSPHSPI
jgi:hypothetical protein